MLTKKDDWWWALIDEMCNSKKVDWDEIYPDFLIIEFFTG